MLSRNIFYVVLLVGVSAAVVSAESTAIPKPVTYQPLLDVKLKCDAAIKKADADYQKAVAEAKQAAVKELNTVLPQAMKAGDLDAANAVKATRDKLQEDLKAEATPSAGRGAAARFVGSWSKGNILAKADGTIAARSGRTGNWAVTGPNQVTVKWAGNITEVIDFCVAAEATKPGAKGIWVKDTE